MAQPPHPVIDNFGNFYQSWLAGQQSFLQQLLQSAALPANDKEEAQLRLINQILAHYQHYYEELSKAAGEDVFRAFSAPWLTPFERTLLWIGGFKPSIVLRLLDAAVKDLAPPQRARLEEVKAEVRRNERDLTEAMASLQEMVAAPPIVALARRAGRVMDREICEMEGAIEELKTAMVMVLNRADGVRGSAVMKVMELLDPDQRVRLLAAAAEFQLRIRRWGVHREQRHNRES